MSREKSISRRGVLGGVALAGGAAALNRAPVAFAQPSATRPALPASVDADGKLYSDTHWDRPGEPGRDYTPIITPNGWTLPFRLVDGVKVFHLVAEEVPNHEFAPGLVADCWGYNGSVHGPTIEAVEGDRVRIYVTNKLPAPTSVHWHGILLPNGMDGVAGLTQKLIRPGETFMYEFTLRQFGSHFYHPHHDEMTQMAMGMMGLFIVHPRRPAYRPDRDYALMLSEWRIDPGTRRPNPNEMIEFNLLTFNGKAFPATDPLLAKLGDWVRVRLSNGSATDHHPIHLHGYSFWVTETDGGPIPESAWWPQTTALVPVGSSRAFEFTADEPGDWALHCHMTHHTMNQMGHEFDNTVGVNARAMDAAIQPLLPAYMTMGETGMGEMTEHVAAGHMPTPENSIPMVGGAGPFDYIAMGGMFTILKVRPTLDPAATDVPWHDHPPRTVALLAPADAMRRDGVSPDAASAPRAPVGLKKISPLPVPSHSSHENHATPTPGGETIYICSHHPDVAQKQPGRCPKCGMMLKAKTDG